MKAIVLMHVESEGPGTLGTFLQNHGVEIETRKLYAKDPVPTEISGLDAVISMGGPMNVYEEDEYPFLKDETDFLRQAIDDGIPVMGVCLGAQMIAKACGKKVYRAPEEEVGWCEISLTEKAREDYLFKDLPSPLTVFQWHGDTFDVPDGGVLLASSEVCENQAFRYKNAYGLQFHVEVTGDMLEEWFEDSDKKEEILEKYKMLRAHLDKNAEKIYHGFLKLMQKAL